jgi:hypothetical protein
MIQKINLIFIFLHTFIGLSKIDAQSIEGKWLVTKGSTEFTMEIKGSNGTLVALSSVKDFTDKLLEGNVYQDITSAGANKWNGTRNTWKYTGVTRKEQENGRWEKAGNCQFTLSQDGNTLSVSGHWTWKRKDPIEVKPNVPANSSSTKNNNPTKADGAFTSIDVNYEGVKVNYSAYARSKDTVVLIKIQNTLQQLDAKVVLSNAKGLNDAIVLSPNNIVTKTVSSFPFNIAVEFSKYKAVSEPLGARAMELIKRKVKEQVTIKSNTINHTNYTITGVRG